MAEGTWREVAVCFGRLGLTSFGGPVAHLGYFRAEIVERRGWLDDGQYAQLLALCQFLPGPASSQMGFAIGLLRAGWAGALAAFLAFTLPSALLLLAFAALLPGLQAGPGAALLHGLKLVAVVVVAHAVLGMARQLCPDGRRAGIATLSAALILVTGTAWMQLLCVLGGALAGLWLCRDLRPPSGAALQLPHGRSAAWVLLGLFLVLLLGLPLLTGLGPLAQLAEAFYRAGALVFGGGHVVLPLLEAAVVEPGWLSADEFMAGYGAAQAVPGPMFSVAAYLGARAGELPLAGAGVALTAIFLPGFLLLAGVLPLWRSLAERRHAAPLVAGVNAAVVGVLGAALYDPVWTSAVHTPVDVAIALVGFSLLAAGGRSPLWVVLWCVAASAGAALAGAP